MSYLYSIRVCVKVRAIRFTEFGHNFNDYMFFNDEIIRPNMASLAYALTNNQCYISQITRSVVNDNLFLLRMPE